MATGRIKGITIEIGGDTTQLDKSLKNVDKTLSKTQKELNDVNRLLKFDPKNTDLLRQKQELLAKSVDSTKERLETLKEAQKQMDEAGVDKTSDEYRGLQREIAATEGKLKSLQSQQKEFGSVTGKVLQEVGKEWQEVGKKVTDVGTNITKNVTAPILAVGAASVAAFGEVDNGIDTIAKKTGATGDQLDEFGGQMNDIATSIPTSFETAGEAIGEVNTRFKVTGDELTDLSTLFIKFADINDTDVTSSIDAAQKAMAAWGLETDDAAHYLDVITKVSQDTGISVDTLQSGLSTNATAFKEMGLSADQAAVLIGQIETSGADVNTVMSGLSKALKNSTKDGKSMDEALQELQEAMLNNEDEAAALQMAYELFGRSGDQVFNALKNGTLSFNNLGDAALDAAGAVEETFDATKSPMENFQTVLNQLVELGYEIGNAIMPLIQSAMDSIVPVIQSVVEWWTSLDEETQDFIVQAALVVAAIGPVITMIGGIITTIGTLTEVIGTVTTAASALFAEGGALAGLLSGPVVLGIGAAIAAGVLLWKNWDKIKEMAIKVAGIVKEKWDAIKTSITNAINNAKDAVKRGIDAIKGMFNFQFQWPKLKMPHFTVQGTLNPLKWLEQGMPKIGVEWYKKAAETPYYFNSPSIIGVGDVPEVVIGADAFKRMTGGTVTNNITIVQQPGQTPEQMARVVIRAITKDLKLAGRDMVTG